VPIYGIPKMVCGKDAYLYIFLACKQRHEGRKYLYSKIPKIRLISVAYHKNHLVLLTRLGSTGASSHRKSCSNRPAAEPVLPYNGTGENGGRMLLSCSPFLAGEQDGKNPAVP